MTNSGTSVRGCGVILPPHSWTNHVQIRSQSRLSKFTNMQTNDISIFAHSIMYFAFISILILNVGIHVNAG
ncbi:hypothetical protein KSP40_PGU010500 [Platanthera guangdongensis]|uniref:Uncharacterized protein n=1 Tax=Platanthera guangdongensis TaxID=2320717 RepID=A0ABR2M7M4_9ASPA